MLLMSRGIGDVAEFVEWKIIVGVLCAISLIIIFTIIFLSCPFLYSGLHDTVNVYVVISSGSNIFTLGLFLPSL
jgi:hypothetical protein